MESLGSAHTFHKVRTDTKKANASRSKQGHCDRGTIEVTMHIECCTHTLKGRGADERARKTARREQAKG